MLSSSRFIQALTVAAASGAVAAPAAYAEPLFEGSPDASDARAAALTAQAPTTRSDPRSPDTRDAAAGRVVSSSQPVEVVEVRSTTGGGFDWGDAGIGAGGAVALLLIGAGGVVLGVSHHRGRGPSALAG